jgi:hypothetical protein
MPVRPPICFPDRSGAGAGGPDAAVSRGVSVRVGLADGRSFFLLRPSRQLVVPVPMICLVKVSSHRETRWAVSCHRCSTKASAASRTCLPSRLPAAMAGNRATSATTC